MATKRVCQHSITVFNYMGEDSDGNAMYSAAVLKNVHTHINEGIGSGDVANDNTRVHIFDDVVESEKAFLPHDKWVLLSDTEKARFWTLCSEGKDYFSLDHEPVHETMLPSNCSLFRIIVVSRRKIGSRRMWHWRIEGR